MRRHLPLLGWLAASAVSLTGTRVSMIALPWFVLTTTGSPTLTGLVALAEMAPLVTLKVLSGPIIDRLGPRRVAVVCDAASLVAVGAIPLLHGLGALPLWSLLTLVAIAGALRGPGDAAKHAMAPFIAEHANAPIERVTGLESTIERAAGMLGAALAGVLIAAIGAAEALWLDALGFGVSALVLAWTTRPLSGPVPAETGERDAPYRTRLHEGWRFLRRDRVLLGIALMVAATNLFDTAYFSVLMPVWADEPGRGPALLGLLLAIAGGCSALGSVAASIWAARLPRYVVFLVAFLIAGAPRFVALALDIPLAGVIAVIAAGGLAAGFLNPILGAVIFERIPAPLVGRVSSLINAMAFALMPLGGLLAGALISGFGLPIAMLAIAAGYFCVTILPALDPRWREMDRRSTVHAS
ncbi:MAG: MFS transporter [Microbacteriaceae bacterium]|nr:MFS transporter [Microbacteriaceae bacterium]